MKIKQFFYKFTIINRIPIYYIKLADLDAKVRILYFDGISCKNWQLVKLFELV